MSIKVQLRVDLKFQIFRGSAWATVLYKKGISSERDNLSVNPLKNLGVKYSPFYWLKLKTEAKYSAFYWSEAK